MSKVLVDSGWYKEVFKNLNDLSLSDPTPKTAWNAINFAKAALSMADTPKELETVILEAKVFVVWDPLYERVISVHGTEAGAEAKCGEMDASDPGGKRTSYHHEYASFEVEQ